MSVIAVNVTPISNRRLRSTAAKMTADGPCKLCSPRIRVRREEVDGFSNNDRINTELLLTLDLRKEDSLGEFSGALRPVVQVAKEKAAPQRLPR